MLFGSISRLEHQSLKLTMQLAPEAVSVDCLRAVEMYLKSLSRIATMRFAGEDAELFLSTETTNLVAAEGVDSRKTVVEDL